MTSRAPRRRFVVLAAGVLTALVGTTLTIMAGPAPSPFEVAPGAGTGSATVTTTPRSGGTAASGTGATGADKGRVTTDGTRPSSATTPARATARATTRAGATPAAADLPAGATPLKVVIEGLTPSSLPPTEKERRDQQVRVTGRIVNDDDQEWRDLKAYLLTSYNPMSTDSEVEAAVASDPATYLGERLITPGLYQDVGDLAAGASTRFRLTVPMRQLEISGRPGVYWLAVQVLGLTDDGRDDEADGRARTLVPLVPERRNGTRLAVGLPVRRHVVRDVDGTLEYPGLWAGQLGRSGRLDRVLRLAATASSAGPQRTAFPLTWMVDGAVLDAARSLLDGNPPLDLAATGSAVTGPADDPTDDPTDEPSEDSSDDAAARVATADPEARVARSWLRRFSAAATSPGSDVLALPYGDLDVSAAVTGERPELVEQALTDGAASLSASDVGSDPLVAPLSGYLSPEAARALDPDVRVVLADDALDPDPIADPAPDEGPAVLAAPRGGSIVAAPAPDQLWGPGPTGTHGALAVRQKLLADAAVRALGPDRDQPVLRVLPATWDPGRGWQRAEFFRGLSVPWLEGVSLSGVADPSSIGSEVARGDDLLYPETEADAEVPTYDVAATAELVDRGRTLDELLTDGSSAGTRIVQQALLTSSLWSRPFPDVATARARGAVLRVDDWLESISIRGPEFVTMSSESGTFQVTLVNGLDQPVTVGLSATVRGTGAPLQLTTSDPVELPPGGRRPMRIEADATDIGVHQVTLQAVSRTGRPVGDVSTMSVRTSKVGLILWFIMAGGAVALFGAITVRLVRRLLAARRRAQAAA